MSYNVVLTLMVIGLVVLAFSGGFALGSRDERARRRLPNRWGE